METRINVCARRISLAGLCMLLAAAAISCDSKSNKGSGTVNGAPVSRDNPATPLGKSAKAARDAKSLVDGEQQQALQAANTITGEGNFTAIAGMNFPIPAGWAKVELPSSGMRAAEFTVKAAEGTGTPPASVVFFSLGGSAEANIKRWKDQVQDPLTVAKLSTVNLGQVTIHKIAVSGTYIGMGPGGGAAPAQPNTRFLGAVVDGPSGSVQVRMTGPIETVEDAEAAWDAMLAGIQVK
jgi:hypothetical protein